MSITINAKGTSVSSFNIGKNKFTLDASNLTTQRSWILPDNNGSSGNVLTTDGSGNLSWTSTGTPAGFGEGWLQYKSNTGTFAASQVLVFDPATEQLSVPSVSLDFIDFNTLLLPSTVQGRLYWDSDAGTLSLVQNSEVIQQIGQETYYRAKNQTGSTIANGTVVRAAGTVGASGIITVNKMIADGSIPSKYTMGIVTQDILNGENGYVTAFGLVRGINTTGAAVSETWADGDVLWVHPTIAGAMTKVEPSAPNLKIVVALVVHAATNGSIFVRVDENGNLGDLHNVSTAGASNNQVLTYNSTTSVWAPASVSASNVSNTASGNIIATNVQAAINELDSEKVAKSGDSMAGVLSIAPTSSSASLTISNAGAGNLLNLVNSTTTMPVIVTGEGKIRAGSATAPVAIDEALPERIETIGGGGSDSSIGMYTYTNSAQGSNTRMYRARGTQSSPETLVENDVIGQVAFNGYAPSGIFRSVGQIRGFVDGTPSGDLIPGRLVFTTTSNATSQIPRLTINSNGAFGLGSSADYGTSGQVLITAGSTATPTWSSSLGLSSLNVDTNSSSNAVRITQTGTGNALLIEDSTTPDATPVAITAAGKVLIGNTTDNADTPNSGLQLFGSTGNNVSSISLNGYGLSSGISFRRSGSGTLGVDANVSADDTLGSFNFVGYGDTSYQTSASVFGLVDSVDAGVVKGRLTFNTKGSAGNDERMRISSTGALGFAGANFGTSGQVLVSGGSTTTPSWASTFTGSASLNVLKAGDTMTGVLDITNTTASTTPTTGALKVAGGVGVGGVITVGNTAPLQAGTILTGASTSTATIVVQGQAGTAYNANRFSDDTTGPNLNLQKSRGTIASPAAVQIGDAIGGINFTARTTDTTAIRTIASITSNVLTVPTDATTGGSGYMFLRVLDPVSNGLLTLLELRPTYIAAGAPLYSPLGSASSPSLTFTGDTNTGIFSPAADNIAISTGSSERLRVNSTGQVIVGTTTAYATSGFTANNLQAHATSGAAGLTVGGWGATPDLQFLQSASSTIGTRSASTAFQTPMNIVAAADDGTNFIQGAGITAVLEQNATTGLAPMALYFSTMNTSGTFAERMRITSGGLVGIGTSGPSAALDVNGSTIRLRTARTPASATATGNAGDICWDENYIYVCVATNTWKRTAISTW